MFVPVFGSPFDETVYFFSSYLNRQCMGEGRQSKFDLEKICNYGKPLYAFATPPRTSAITKRAVRHVSTIS